MHPAHPFRILNTYQISTATEADAQRISTLVNSAYRGDYSKKGWTTEADLLDGTRTDAAAIADIIARPSTVLLVYREGDEISGCVELDLRDGQLYLGMLTVDPAKQANGIGKILLHAGEDFARNKKCDKIFMTVISVRSELIDWYKRHGYADTGHRKPFNFIDPRFGKPKKPLEFVVLEKQL